MKQNARNEVLERELSIKSTRVQNHHADVSCGPHKSGLPIQASEKRCILNLYQSYRNDGKSNHDAKLETAKRLQYSIESVSKIVREKLSTGTVQDNNASRISSNAYEKLSEEEENDLRKLVSQ